MHESPRVDAAQNSVSFDDENQRVDQDTAANAIRAKLAQSGQSTVLGYSSIHNHRSHLRTSSTCDYLCFVNGTCRQDAWETMHRQSYRICEPRSIPRRAGFCHELHELGRRTQRHRMNSVSDTSNPLKRVAVVGTGRDRFWWFSP